MKNLKRIFLSLLLLTVNYQLSTVSVYASIDLPNSPTSEFESSGLPAQIVEKILPIVIVLGGFITVIIIIISAIQFITSSGDPKGAEAAKGRLTYAIIGLIIILLSFAILQLINYLFLRSSITHLG